MSKYWVLLKRSVGGPYAPDDLPALEGYGAATLVCPETRQGADMLDWLHAGEVPELYPHLGPPPSVVAQVYDPLPACDASGWQRAVVAGLREELAKACRREADVRRGLADASRAIASLEERLAYVTEHLKRLAAVETDARARAQAAAAAKLALELRQARLAELTLRIAVVKAEVEQAQKAEKTTVQKTKPGRAAKARPKPKPKKGPVLGALPVLKAPTLKPLS